MRLSGMFLYALEVCAAFFVVAALTIIVLGACALAFPLRLLLDWQVARSHRLGITKP